MNKVIYIDNGHGEGNDNASPDGKIKEYRLARVLSHGIVAGLCNAGIDARLLVPEEADIRLDERVRRVNALCGKIGSSNVVVVSIHLNASGSSKAWRSAKGFVVLVSPNASAESKRLATLHYEEAVARGMKGNRQQGPYVRKSLTILDGTKCPAILTESGFMDNKEDAAFLLSTEGQRTIVDVHVSAIMKYLQAR